MIYLPPNAAIDTQDVGDDKYTDHKSHGWISGAVSVASPQKGRVAVCGHRWANQHNPDEYLMNGVCYWTDHDLKNRFKKNIPLVSRRLQNVEIDGKNSYGYAYGAGKMSRFY